MLQAEGSQASSGTQGGGPWGEVPSTELAPLCSLMGGCRACCKGAPCREGEQERPLQPSQDRLVWGCSSQNHVSRPREAQEAGLQGRPPSGAVAPSLGRLLLLLHGLQEGQLLGLFLLVPSLILQPGGRRGRECASPGCGLCFPPASASPVLDDALDDEVRGEVAPAVDLTEDAPFLGLLKVGTRGR